MVYLDNHLITLNAFDGTQLNGTSLSNLFFPFKGLLKDDVNILRSYVVVLNAQFCYSFYVIHATNNTLLVDNITLSTTFTITVPIGNYNASTLITALTNEFINSGNGTGLTITFNSLNGKLSFTSSVTEYTFHSDNNGSTIGTILGLDKVNITNTLISPLVFPFPLNLLGKEKLYINSTNLQNAAYSSFNNGFSSTIACVPVNVPPYSLIQYICTVDQQKNILTNKVLDGIDIQILDTENKFINFNNVPWSLTLVLSIEKLDTSKIFVKNFNNYLTNEPQNLPKEENKKDLDLELLES